MGSSESSDNSQEETYIGFDEFDEKFVFDTSKNIIIVLGLANVGKSSVVGKYFDKMDVSDIKNIRPTVLQNIRHKPNLFLGINRSFRVFDLGGQEVYLSRHLEQKSLLGSALCHIWVVDSQGGSEKLMESLKYFQKVVEILKTIPRGDRPKIFVLNHKHEESDSERLSLEEIKENFAEQIRIPIESFYDSNIFDESIFEALSDIFYRVLAPEIIQQVFHFVDLNQLVKQFEKNKENSSQFLFSQGKLWALKIKENFSRQQMGLDPLPSPTTARALIKQLQLFIIGGKLLLKVPTSQIPSSLDSEHIRLFIEGIISTQFEGIVKILNKTENYIEFEISRTK